MEPHLNLLNLFSDLTFIFSYGQWNGMKCTYNVHHTNPNNFLNTISIDSPIQVDFFLSMDLQSHQMNQESDKLLLNHKISCVTFTKYLIDDILYDGTLWCEQKFIVNFWCPHLPSFLSPSPFLVTQLKNIKRRWKISRWRKIW